MNNIGLLGSDQALMSDPTTASMVSAYSQNPFLFSRDFAASMVKLENIGILTGQNGQIRKKCGFVNWGRMIISRTSVFFTITMDNLKWLLLDVYILKKFHDFQETFERKSLYRDIGSSFISDTREEWNTNADWNIKLDTEKL